MVTVCEKDMCAGCMACIDICPKDAITIMRIYGKEVHLVGLRQH